MVNSTANQLPSDIQFEKQLGTLTTFIRVMRQAGLPIEKALQMPIDDPEMRERLVRAWIAGVLENGAVPATAAVNFTATPSQIRAREIMGRNFLGVEEAMRHYGEQFTEEQLAALAEVPFSEAVLEECKNTHVLVAGFPISILDIRAKAPNKKPKTFYSYKDARYNNQAFATNEKVNVRWYLVRKEAVADSTYKTYDKQKALLSEHEEVPRACELVYAVVLYFLAADERLFPNIYVRCSDVSSGGDRVYVGYFDSDGLRVGYWGDYHHYDYIGLAASRKF
jgi:hypothetical protein